MTPCDPDIRTNLTLAEAMGMAFRFVTLDVETANGDPASICQIGLACVRADRSIVTFGFLVNPGSAFEAFNTQLHGISAKTVQHAPGFPDVVAPLRPLLERQPMVQHSGFDKRAMNGACGRYGLAPLNSVWHDSVKIARRAWPELRGNGGHGLGNLKSVLNLDFQHHDATEDARAAAQVVLLAEAATGLRFEQLATRPIPTPPRAKAETPAILPGRRDAPHFGKIACITGRLSQPRAQITARAVEAGVTIHASMSPDVTLLVMRDSGLDLQDAPGKSSKLRKTEALIAQGANIQIISESEFLALIAE